MTATNVIQPTGNPGLPGSTPSEGGSFHASSGARRAPSVVATPRLVGSRLSPPDLEAFCLYYGDAEVMRSQAPFARPYTPEAAGRLFEAHLRHWEEHGFGTWIFRDDRGGFVGRGGLRSFELETGPEVELFYGVVSERWELGYGTEMAVGVVRAAFDHLAVDSLVAFSLPSNEASQRILAGIGFEKVGALEHTGLLYDHHVLTRAGFAHG